MERRLVWNAVWPYFIFLFQINPKRVHFKINGIFGISNQMRNSMNGASVLLRVRSTRITAVCICLHGVSLPICIIVIANDIITR
jgi:hypothetical protein